MSATLERNPEHQDLADRLDQLIPPAAGPFKTLAVSATLISAAIATAILIGGGYVYPRPTTGTSFSSHFHLEIDEARAAVSAEVMMPNNSNRAVRITDIGFDGPGADLIDVGVIVETPIDTEASESGDEATATVPMSPRSEVAMPLPVTVPAGSTAFIVVWFRPTACVDQPGPWGIVDTTVDFGDGAFPPFSNSVSLAQDPVAVVDPDATAENGGEMTTIFADGDFLTVSGPLAGACEVLR